MDRDANWCLMSGVLADVLRNHLMDHTGDVFRQSYQSDHVRVNPLKVRFQRFIKDDDQNCALQNAMRAMSFKGDSGASIYITSQDLEQFERRRDVSELRMQIEAAKAVMDRKAYNPIRMKLRSLIKALSDLRLMEKREQYFEEIYRLRRLGQSTTGVASAAAVATEQQAAGKKGRGGSRRRGELSASNVTTWLAIWRSVRGILANTSPNDSSTCSWDT